MQNDQRPEIGSTVVIQKADFDRLLSNLKANRYELLGPRIQNDTLIYGPIESLQDLPRGFVTEQEAGRFRLVQSGHNHYFDLIPGAQSWKQFLFPSQTEMFKLRKEAGTWKIDSPSPEKPFYAFIGVRGCELAAIHIQDAAFLRPDFVDPTYHDRRERAFILSVNCLHPAGTCFCTSMGTGPRVGAGFDLNLTELEDLFILEVGSELGRAMMTDVPFEAASAFLLNAANRAIEHASQSMGRKLDTSDLPALMLDNLENPHWHSVAKRCLSCTNCTQVCPTCFCWDAVDTFSLDGVSTTRARVWDSCFNPSYSYQAGGNTRPNIQSRYRQWITHKLGTWKQQYGTFGCVGCGRCITWCPAAIDITAEVAALREENKR